MSLVQLSTYRGREGVFGMKTCSLSPLQYGERGRGRGGEGEEGEEREGGRRGGKGEERGREGGREGGRKVASVSMGIVRDSHHRHIGGLYLE